MLVGITVALVLLCGVLTWMLRQMSRGTMRVLKVVRAYRVPGATYSTCVDRVSYTVPVPQTLSLGPVETLDHFGGGGH